MGVRWICGSMVHRIRDSTSRWSSVTAAPSNWGYDAAPRSPGKPGQGDLAAASSREITPYVALGSTGPINISNNLTKYFASL